MAREHAIRLLRDDELGGACARGNMGPGTCGRDAVYMTELQWDNGKAPCSTRLTACAIHAGAWALHNDVDLPMPVRVVARRRESDQQVRDVVARVAREVRELRRDQAEFFERLAGLFSMASPSQRRLPLGMDAGAHRQQLWGDVREGMTG